MVDDGYESTRTAETMRQLNEQDRVFGIIGSVDTPTCGGRIALRAGPPDAVFTGTSLLRPDPQPYVFNDRAAERPTPAFFGL